MGKAEGEGSRPETQAHHLGGGAQADRGSTASTVGKAKGDRIKEKTGAAVRRATSANRQYFRQSGNG